MPIGCRGRSEQRINRRPRPVLLRSTLDLHSCGVILTGALNDGRAGLYMVKQQGGIAIVQDPKVAAEPAPLLASCGQPNT